jgi:acetolactate synthase-1/2/3 large subunit
MVTPLATAQMDSIPLVCFSGQVATKAIGNDAFQEADVTGITRPCTKWNYLVKDIHDLPRIVNEAFLIATSGRPGAVLVDLPKDVTSMVCPEELDDTPRAHMEKRRNSYAMPGMTSR